MRADDLVFESILDAAPDGVVISRSGMVLFANDAAARILGVGSRDHVIGCRLDQFLGVEGARTMQERIELMRRTGSLLAPLEYAAKRPDGSTVIGEVTSMITSYQGQPAVVAFVRDVTERVQMREQLARSDRLAAVGTAAAGVAHEINNPLQIATLALGKLERQIGPDAAAKRSVGELSVSLERIASIVRDLITFSRAEKFEAREVDLKSALDAAARFVRHRLPEQVRLEAEVPTLPPIQGSAHQLEQVMVNLLMNALQALPLSGGEIRLRGRDEGEGTVSIVVSDTGAGIPADVLPSVFDPFFTTKPPGAGTGLGLAVCQGIVARHGGRMEIESEVGKGTTVLVCLPITAHREATARADTFGSNTEPSGLKILVVDDEPAIVQALELLLTGNRVLSVTNGTAALERLHSEDFDVILCDLTMRPVSGRDVFEAVRARRPTLAARFVFMTGGANLAELAAFLETLPAPPLQKPFDLPTLHRAIARVVEVVP